MKMDTSRLTDAQRNLRINVRNFLMVATPEELQKELQLSLDAKQPFRAECVRELIAEAEAEAGR